uniref:Uncharacterized protein n=1 Tax=Oryza glumipatula TaxID=40148 RepID=A0A0D9ZSC0_9ORYZ
MRLMVSITKAADSAKKMYIAPELPRSPLVPSPSLNGLPASCPAGRRGGFKLADEGGPRRAQPSGGTEDSGRFFMISGEERIVEWIRGRDGG